VQSVVWKDLFGWDIFCSVSQFCSGCLQIPYFEDVGVIALQYLDMLVQKDNLQKSQFFKGLSKVIEKLPLVSDGNHCFGVLAYCIAVFSY